MGNSYLSPFVWTSVSGPLSSGAHLCVHFSHKAWHMSESACDWPHSPHDSVSAKSHYSSAALLRLQCASSERGGRTYDNTDCWVLPLEFLNLDLGWDSRICISKKFVGKADTAGPRATLWERLPDGNSRILSDSNGPDALLFSMQCFINSSISFVPFTASHLLRVARQLWFIVCASQVNTNLTIFP